MPFWQKKTFIRFGTGGVMTNNLATKYPIGGRHRHVSTWPFPKMGVHQIIQVDQTFVLKQPW